MKQTNLKALAIALFVGIVSATNSGHAQYYGTDSLSMRSSTNMQPTSTVINSHHYQWNTPMLDVVDVESLKQHKTDNQNYLTNIEALEDVLKKNKKELSSYYKQAKDQSKILSSERKNLKEKQKFYKQDEKMSKTEKKLRDKEVKMIKQGRAALKKEAKGMSSWQLDEKTKQFEEREYQVKIAEAKWKAKRDATQKSIEALVNEKKELDKRELEIKDRMRELDRYQSELDLKSKQLALEKKQVKHAIKMTKSAIKQQK